MLRQRPIHRIICRFSSSTKSSDNERLSDYTKLVNFDHSKYTEPFHPTSVPIFQTATFAQPSATSFGEFDYTRSGNPTRAALESQLAAIENSQKAFSFNSGMAALATVFRLLKAGEGVIAGDDLYGGAVRLLSTLGDRQGSSVTYVDMCDLERVEQALQEEQEKKKKKTRLVMMETPSNPMMRICDIRAIAALAHKYGALLVVDNTMMSPWIQKPLSLGADIVMHSATKFISGHSDVTAGVLATNDPELARELAWLQNAEGTASAPFDCWLLLRGIKTLGIRLDRQQQTAMILARHLQSHPLVKRVFYPGLTTHEGYALHNRQATGAGAVMSFDTGAPELSRQVVDRVRLFKRSVSFGGATSVIELPAYFSHASVPLSEKKRLRFGSDLVRLSVGLEDPADLKRDLDLAFQRLPESTH